MNSKIWYSATKAMSMYQKGVGVLLGVLLGVLVGCLASYPRPSTKTASWIGSWIADKHECFGL